MTFPFPIRPPFSRSESLIDRTTGTNIGDMISAGGLAAAFDGTTSQAAAACATRFNIASTTGYVGKAYGAGKIFSKARVHPSSDAGFTTDTNVTLEIYGKNGTPANSTDGTLIGTSGSSADTTSPIEISSADTSNAYTNIWVRVLPATLGSKDGHVAELELYELV